MSSIKIIVKSIISSLIITAVSGLVNSTPFLLAGANWYGFPFTWLRKLVIAPQYNPWRVDVSGFAANLIFWFVVSFLIISLLDYISVNKNSRHNTKSSRSRK